MFLPDIFGGLPGFLSGTELLIEDPISNQFIEWL